MNRGMMPSIKWVLVMVMSFGLGNVVAQDSDEPAENTEPEAPAAGKEMAP